METSELHSRATGSQRLRHSPQPEDWDHEKPPDRIEGMTVRTLEHRPAVACDWLETATAGDARPPAATQNDPGRDLYAQRSSYLAGLCMPPAPPWEDLPEQVKDRWRGHAAALG